MIAVEHDPGIWQIRADNPGPMTLEGTNTWIVHTPGTTSAVVIDPGPLLDSHAAALQQALDELGAEVDTVLLTHGHLDHSEYAEAFGRAHGAPVRARDPQWCTGDPLVPGEVIGSAGVALRVELTAGHTSDSVTFVGESGLFTGDTVLGRGTSVVAHPDGRLTDYLDSLGRLHELLVTQERAVYPGHGPVHRRGSALVSDYLQHRRERLQQVAHVLAEHFPELDRSVLSASDTGEQAQVDRVVERVVASVYGDVGDDVKTAAAFSVRAQLHHLGELADGRS